MANGTGVNPVSPHPLIHGNDSVPAGGSSSFLDRAPIFLQTASAQTLAGIFVWTALIITCHQV